MDRGHAAARTDLVERHSPIDEPAGLALRSQEPIAQVDDVVVTMVVAERGEHVVPTLGQLTEDRSLAANPYVNGMRGKP